MKVKELREKSVDELSHEEEALVGQLFALRVQKTTGQLENPMKARHVRRQIARVKTLLREKQPAAAK